MARPPNEEFPEDVSQYDASSHLIRLNNVLIANMLSMACKDVGYQCDFVAKAETENEIMSKVSEHAKTAHHMSDSDFTPELVSKVKGAIKKE